MDVGGHFCPFALGLMIGFTEKNAKEEAETSLLNSPPLLLRGYIRMSSNPWSLLYRRVRPHLDLLLNQFQTVAVAPCVLAWHLAGFGYPKSI